MMKLKTMISNYMYRITVTLVIVIVSILIYIQLIADQTQACETGARTILQIESILEENQKELVKVQEKYSETCLHNVETVARILEDNPRMIYNKQYLTRLSDIVEVDEIHIFDSEGIMVAGTHPQYIGFSFDSGEQIQFFKPMLTDKTLKLVQNITPNTAEGKPMQYSAAWSESGEFIIQVGMEPTKVMEVTEKNELSHIFAHFRVNPEASYYAIDAENGEIIGASDLTLVGKKAEETGILLSKIKEDGNGFHANINGHFSFCYFEKTDTNYIGRVITARELYRRIPSTIFWIFVSLLAVSFFLVRAVIKHLNEHVTDKIYDVNEKLKSIADGNLEEVVDIQSSVEFSQLSDYINHMVKSLLDNNKKMSYVLSRTHMLIGTYDYCRHSQRVRYTENIPLILSLDKETMERLARNADEFIVLLDEIRLHPVLDEPGTYQLGEKFIRLEEIENDGDVFGVAIDVTKEIQKRKQIEKERDIDLLTGLYNRRGMDQRLIELFEEPEKLGISAVILIDADGLKNINDVYGHEKGDLYLKKIAEVISHVGNKGCIASRQGGDEFVILLHNFDCEEELIQTIEGLQLLQEDNFVDLEDNVKVPLRFSLGYSLVNGSDQYYTLLKDADEKMYQNKAERKKNSRLNL